MKVEVLVCGGGPAGVMAAVAAARAGAQVLVVERHPFPGGSSTAALVHPWLSFHNKRGEQVLAGLGQELVDRLQRIGGALGHLRDSIGFVHTLTPFDPDLTKRVMQEMLLESRAQVLVGTTIHAVEIDRQAVTAVRAVNKSGEIRLAADTFIDCTGDADIAFRAGAPMQSTRRDGRLHLQPMTMNFRLSGVDWEPVRHYVLDNPSEFHDETLFEDLQKGEPITAVSGFFSLWREHGARLNYSARPPAVFLRCARRRMLRQHQPCHAARRHRRLAVFAGLKPKAAARPTRSPSGCARPSLAFPPLFFPACRRRLACAKPGASKATSKSRRKMS
jgi:2-polyprenyl-6-methoxyphenol hydroxylase-like FAD-dependent oxidoreductase